MYGIVGELAIVVVITMLVLTAIRLTKSFMRILMLVLGLGPHLSLRIMAVGRRGGIVI